jgi:hypothetical protein
MPHPTVQALLMINPSCEFFASFAISQNFSISIESVLDTKMGCDDCCLLLKIIMSTCGVMGSVTGRFLQCWRIAKGDNLMGKFNAGM